MASVAKGEIKQRRKVIHKFCEKKKQQKKTETGMWLDLVKNFNRKLDAIAHVTGMPILCLHFMTSVPCGLI